MSNAVRTASYGFRPSHGPIHRIDELSFESLEEKPKRYCAECYKVLAKLNSECICYACQDHARRKKFASFDGGNRRNGTITSGRMDGRA